MNVEQLLIAEIDFLCRYPGGFEHPDLVELGKKHKMSKMIEMTQAAFARDQFDNLDAVIENWIRIVSRSSMVSVFEKPTFKTCLQSLSSKQKQSLISGLYAQLHGDEEAGFNQILEVLAYHKVAKWPLLTIIPAYYAPTDAVFIKPTTVKGVIAKYELSDLHYTPRPNWSFYLGYKQAIHELKAKVDAQLSSSNAAFSGFLMMTL
ncbi:hypothetical protein [Reinekea sp. G2M2-21]|uniref:hypothetical protein n=1 Tax=Reinekea sp. G2M2-21 TaxID=2788942 RepID=UPI0018AB45AC|nr:hypothetical protein [Reinekea sp. G2M2-21]